MSIEYSNIRSLKKLIFDSFTFRIFVLALEKLPSDLLTANICSVFKRGNSSTPSNYRPISLTASCCKVMEHIIFHSIMDHIKTNNILISNQHGFRPGFSCQTQLISLIDDISYTMDNHCQTDLILLNFSKAFDTVPHRRLLAKLQYYKINNVVRKWIQSWLTQRTQSVVVDGASSKSTSVLSGVPQGTVLGPLMFLLYINDITDEVSSTLHLFADDCIISNNQISRRLNISSKRPQSIISLGFNMADELQCLQMCRA